MLINDIYYDAGKVPRNDSSREVPLSLRWKPKNESEIMEPSDNVECAYCRKKKMIIIKH